MFNMNRRLWLRLPLAVLRGSVPLPTNVKPFRCVDFVAVESFAVGLICKPSRKMVDGGVAETRLTHSWWFGAGIPGIEARRMGMVESCCERCDYRTSIRAIL